MVDKRLEFYEPNSRKPSWDETVFNNLLIETYFAYIKYYKIKKHTHMYKKIYAFKLN